MKPLACIFNAIPSDTIYFLEQLKDELEVRCIAAGLSADTVQQAAAAQVISVHVSSPVTAELMQAMPALKHIACRSTGYDHIDLEYAKAHGITVTAIPGYGQKTVAEYAVLLMLSVSRHLVETLAATAEQTDRSQLMGHDLSEKTLGIIGTGRIGQHVARIAKGFGMTVLAYDLHPDEATAQELGFRHVSLAELFKTADIITLHAPATPQTRHLLDAAAFAQMKPGVLVINTARGSLINTPALAEALTAKTVAGAGLDVVDQPELLQNVPHVIITGHNAFNTAEALERIRQVTAANVQLWLKGTPQNVVS